MKYVILMGRGIEGTGNTKYAVELQEYLESCGDQVICYANADRKWGREKSHQNHIQLIKYSKEQNKIIQSCTEADKILILSVPAKNYIKETKDAFINILAESFKIRKDIVYFQVDHSIYSIARNFYKEPEYERFFLYITKVITHSKNGDFVKKYKNVLKEVITTSDKLNGINGINFSKYKSYWKPFNEKLNKSIKFIGRAASWKGPYLFRELHEKYFKKEGYICSCEGMEMSIGSLDTMLKSLKPRLPRDDNDLWFDKEHVKQLKEGTAVYERNHPIYMMPPYNNAEALERLSLNQFGIELLLLKDEILGDVFEYAMLEMIAVGVIPIFRKKWGQSFKINGKSLFDYGAETGTIWLDEEHPEKAVQLINELSQNEIMYNIVRNNAFNFYSKYLDNIAIYKQIKELL